MNGAFVQKESESEESQAWSGGKKREAAAKVGKCHSNNR